jgi:uncharacterized RDD family membrane protein YckC
MKSQQNHTAPVGTELEPAGFGRRLGAIVYDLLLVTAVVIFAAVPFVLIVGDTSKNLWTRLAFQIYLLAVIFLYYGWFWTRGGRTLGLLTWKLRLIADGGGSVSWRQAMLRFGAGVLGGLGLGIGLLWALFDRDKRAWHDRLSGTRLVRTPATHDKQTG